MNSSDVQYFDSDFSFEEHARDCIALAQQQQQQQLDKSSSPCHPSSSLLYCGTDNSADIVASSTSSKFEGYNGNFGADDDNDKLQPQSQANFWNAFHTNHSAGNFYKPRRYLTKSFPCIMRYLLDETPHRSDDNHSESYQEVDQRSTKGDDKIILEIGSGSGSSCIPIIKQYSEIMLMKQQQCRNDGDKVVLDQYCNILLACDSSLVAVETTRRAINSISQSSFLFDAFVADPSLTGNDGNNDNEEESNNTSLFVREITMACATMLSSNRRSDTHCDQIELSNTSFGGGITVMHDGEGIVGIVLLVFVLSAVTPSRVEHFMRNVFLVTRPGGKVCFRDYGLYDMPMLRFDLTAACKSAACSTNDPVFVRGEGTIARFFSVESVREIFESVGFSTVELRYCTVFNHNRKTGQKIKRVFVHGVFEKPAL